MTNKIEKIIKDLDFQIARKLDDDDSVGHYIFVGFIKGREVLLKITTKKNNYKFSRFKKELLVDKILEKHNKDLKKPLFVKVDILSSGENNDYFWIIRKYYPGQSLALYRPKGMNFGYDIIRRNFLLSRKNLMDQIIENIEAIYTLDTDFRKLGVEKKDFMRRFVQEIDFEKLSGKTGIDFSKHKDFCLRNKAKYYDKSNIRAVTNDLHPANIICRDDNQLVFADFEHFAFDNYTIDIAFLWLFLWRYRNWQDYLIKKIITSDGGRTQFRISLIRILSTMYRLPFDTGSDKKKMSIERYLKTHKWVKYLVAAGESFESIMKVK